ncbi:MAG: hypothetical protein JO328_12800 [Hyphomicrobiales bacterium]|nr:hypothetical protein [Hyphomicrobiales bacterium]
MNAAHEAAQVEPTGSESLTRRIVAFLTDIGFAVRAGTFAETTPLPGIMVEHGALVFDPARLRFPCDLLHEAGHLAVVPPERRATLHHNVGADPAEEMMAIAWSYAAAVHLGIDPALLFHDEYKGGGPAILRAFTDGGGFGVPMLQWVGMTLEAGRARAEEGAPYPHMRRWLRETGDPPV